MFKISSKVDKMYIIRGERRVFGKKVYKHIQFNYMSGNPIIQTDIGYRQGDVVAFSNREEARAFMKNFFQTRVEQLIGDVRWKIVEYHPQVDKDFTITFTGTNTIYGRCYKIDSIVAPKGYYHGR